MQRGAGAERRSELSSALLSLSDKCLAVQTQPKSVFSKTDQQSFVTFSSPLWEWRRDPASLGRNVAEDKSPCFARLGLWNLGHVPPLSWGAVPGSPDPSDQPWADGPSAATVNVCCQQQLRRDTLGGQWLGLRLPMQGARADPSLVN